MEDNKNSFRDMILIIFVVLICFGITIYGIAYLTGKIFSGSSTPEISENERIVDVSTNPEEGDTLTFTQGDEQADEVTPDVDNLRTTFTPPSDEDLNEDDIISSVISQEDNLVADNFVEEEPKEEEKQEIKQEKPKKPAVRTTGAYAVQIVSVQSKTAAEKEMAKYKSKYPDVFIRQVEIEGVTWYRVRLGLSDTKAEAEQTAQKVASEFNIQPLVTKNN